MTSCPAVEGILRTLISEEPIVMVPMAVSEGTVGVGVGVGAMVGAADGVAVFSAAGAEAAAVSAFALAVPFIRIPKILVPANSRAAVSTV